MDGRVVSTCLTSTAKGASPPYAACRRHSPASTRVKGALDAFTLTVHYDLAAITPQAMKTQLAVISYPVSSALSGE